MGVTFLKNGKSYRVDSCYRSLNLLAHAQMIELETGSQCGGHGKCGKDLLNISDQTKLSPPSEIEKHQLGAQNISAGWRLACQCFPEQDGVEIQAEISAKIALK